MNISKDQRSEQHLSIMWSDVGAVISVCIHTSPFERSLSNPSSETPSVGDTLPEICLHVCLSVGKKKSNLNLSAI